MSGSPDTTRKRIAKIVGQQVELRLLEAYALAGNDVALFSNAKTSDPYCVVQYKGATLVKGTPASLSLFFCAFF